MYYENYEADLDAILNGSACVQLDLSIPEHKEFFLRSHGGKELLRTQFKGIYNAFCKTRDMHQTRRENGCAVQGANEAKPYSCSVDVPYIITPVKGKAGQKSNQTCQMTATARANVALDRIGAVCMDGFVKETGKHNQYVSIWKEFGPEQLKKCSGRCVDTEQGSVSNPTQKEFRTVCCFDYMDRSGTYLTSVVTSVESTGDESVIEPIEKFEVLAPVTKKAGRKRIVVGYKDREQFDPDYPYFDVAPVGNDVKVMLPMKGVIRFKSEYKPVGFCKRRSRAISMYFQEDLSVSYGYTMLEIEGKFKISGQEVTFTLDDDWRTTFSYQKFQAGLVASLDCPFRFTVFGPDTQGIKKNHDVPLSITSNSDLPEGEKYYISTGRDVYIPEIEYYWGCFGKDTQIQMADGTQKKITEIKAGDWVAVYEEEAREVLRLTSGTEPKLVHIETEDGSRIALTDNHPILTARGIVMACQVSPADQMVMADGAKSPVRFVYLEDYHDNIYNLDLGKDAAHLIYADGFIAGDLGSQNNAVKQREGEQRPNPQAEALFAELSALRATLKVQRGANHQEPN